MNSEDIEIGRAELRDVHAIVALAARNAPDRGGELSVRLERDDVAAAIQGLLGVVARRKGKLIGFVLAGEKTGPHPPIVQAMLRVYSGRENAYTYGPVCVDESARGEGIAAMMFEKLRRLLPGRDGILFIKASNEASLRAHRKMGMREVGQFTFRGTPLVIFTYDA